MSRWHREILFFNLVAEMALKKFVGIVTYCIENVASHRNFTGISKRKKNDPKGENCEVALVFF